MHELQTETPVPVAKVVALAVQRILEEALPLALELTRQSGQVVDLIVRVWTLEHADLGRATITKVSVVLRKVHKLVRLSCTVQGTATGQHEEGSLTVPGAGVEIESRWTRVLDNVCSCCGCLGAVVVEGAVLWVWEVTFSGAGE